jgi:hypothetical protein
MRKLIVGLCLMLISTASLLLSGCATHLLIDSTAWNKKPYVTIVKVPTENDKEGVAELRPRIGKNLTKAQKQSHTDQFVKQLEEVCGGSVEIDDFKLNWQLFPRGILYPFPPFGPRLPLTIPFHCD